MTDATATALTHGPATTLTELEIEHGLPPGWGGGLGGRALFAIALAFSAFQLATSIYAILPTQVLRTVHVGFLVLVGAALIANHKAATRWGRAFGWACGLVGFGVGLYQWIFYLDLVNRAGDLTTADMTVGIVGLVLLFTVAWRLMGAALPLICLAFLAYGLFGHLLPRPLDHRPFDLDQIVEQMAFGTEGVYATPTGVSATYIFLFILFGSFLERAGMINLFNDVALGLVGWAKGGAAKVAVISSALMGTISGSGVANVVTVGQFTIPLMKRFGYQASFAGGVEATASMGGQIMPPVMGAVAFIMAENIGVPYAEIVKAAIIPAVLYFASAFWMVHLEAGKRGLIGIPRAELPSPMAALKKQWHLALPLAVLVYMLMDGFTPLFAGSVGLALTVIMILGGAFALNLKGSALRIAYWVAIGLVAATVLKTGVTIVLSLVALLIAVNLMTRGGRETLALCRDSLADGARQALPVGLACAIVGTVIGTLTLTGSATILGNFIVSFGQDSLFLCLVLVMLLSLVLGTGLPTIPTYIITASLAAPALLKLGVPVDHQPHVRLLLRHHRRSHAPGRVGGAGGGAHREGVARRHRLAGDACRAGRLPHPLHGRLRADADAAIRRRAGRPVRLLGRSRVGAAQGADDDLALRGRRDRLPHPAHDAPGTRRRRPCGRFADRTAAMVGRSGITALRAPRRGAGLARAGAGAPGSLMAVCLVGAAIARLSVAAFTLSWTHSVEHTRWEEDWQAAPNGLTLAQARIESMGAGMETPPEARFDGRWWRWRPPLPILPELRLARSDAAPAGWTLCIDGSCRAVADRSERSDVVVVRWCD